jgi:hypothetical protein
MQQFPGLRLTPVLEEPLQLANGGRMERALELVPAPTDPEAVPAAAGRTTRLAGFAWASSPRRRFGRWRGRECVERLYGPGDSEESMKQ